MKCYVGDPHNSGKMTWHDKKKLIVNKPRSVFWENSFLNHEGSLRLFIQQALGNESNFLFQDIPFFGEQINDQLGKVTFLHCKNLIDVKEVDKDFWKRLGVFIGVTSWLGIIDLNKENIGFFKNKYSNTISIIPLDIESLFWYLKLPHQTGLLPSVKSDINSC